MVNSFPDVVKKLLGVEVGRYHVDLLRAETTYYLQNGDSHIVPLPLPNETIAQGFGREEIAAAVLASQREGQPFPQFLLRAMRAGCIGYVAYLEGQRVIYGGRLGDMHIEYFPGSPFKPVPVAP